LIWTLGRKKFTDPIVGYSDAEVGKDIHRRAIIEMDVTFNGVIIPGVKISPDDRTDKSTPFLVNRAFMRNAGLIVNPHKAFVITDEPEDTYSVRKAKGEPHAGIKFEI
jgi:hypothetical protein